MQPVQRSEILDLAAYEALRDGVRAEVLSLKAARRVGLGGHMTLLFENRDTVRYQVQEMLRVERLVAEREILHELATYNELVPGDGELSATLLLEYPDEVQRDRQLRALVGLEQALSLRVGGLPPVPAMFDTRQVSTERISSVHYVRWALPGPHRAAFKSAGLGGDARIVVDHPSYRAEAVLLPAQVMALAQDAGL
ncbi:MAG: hypothetical protein RL199_2430 [Pseudomonadota bacterium]|jgi:hypothetical protein